MPNQDINDIFTQNIKELLKDKDMTYSELATLTGIGKSTISMWMSGKSLPRMELLDKLADIFGVTAGYLTTNHFASPSSDSSLLASDIRPNTLAAHFAGDEYTEAELEEIRKFAEFVKSKRK